MFKRLHGDDPLHLFAAIIAIALAGYAVSRVPLESDVWWKMLIWFVGAALGHDLVLYPLYALADSAAHVRLFRRARPLPAVAGVPWINHLRVPVALSLLLLLVWWPLILQDAPGTYFAATGLLPDVYLGRWLGITGVFFLVAAVTYAVQVRRARGAARVGRTDDEGAADEEPVTTP
jgi:hypothetical protein